MTGWIIGGLVYLAACVVCWAIVHYGSRDDPDDYE